MLPILHDLQAEFGCIPRDVVPLVAEVLNITRAEAHGVISFYHDFREEPAGRHVLKLCRAEACQAMGGRELGDQARRRLGTEWGETSADGAVTLEATYCLGLCACAPAAMIDGRVVGRLNAPALDALIDQAR
jgi:formate dehydrogenase subunit gamma